MESENKEKYIFYDLTPTNDVSLDIYEEAINFSLKNDKILNIAISGSYGSGKSSLLESYKKEHPEKKFLHISLTHFNSMENRINIKEKNMKENSNIEQDNSEENDSKRTKSLTVALEAKILNQMLHQISEKNIPLTNFKIKGKFSKLRLGLSTIFILIFILSFFQIIFFNQWHNFITGLYHIKYVYKIFKISTYPYFKLVSGIILLTLLGIFIYKILKFQKTKNFLKKLNIQGNEFEIAGDNEDSYFDKYLNEVIYLFENSGVDAIIFEDIDRYEISEIFERLREVNRLVNNKLKEEGKTLKFFYLLKDDIFISKDRTKFFDFIIPVIPVVDSSNSYDKIIELLKEDSHYNLNQNFLYKLSLYIDDMRLLKNICNEFKIYYKKLSGSKNDTKINSNKVLSIIVYKNLFPKDFSDLQLNQGFVYNLFSQKDKFLEERIKEINSQIEILNQQKNETLDLRELDLLNDHYYAWYSRGIFSQQEYNDWNSFKYKERKKLLESRKENTISEIEKIEYEKNKLKNAPLKKIITRENIGRIFSCTYTDELKNEQKFEDVKGNSYFKLLKFLIREGYLDERYSYYMAYFYENSLTKVDKNFLIAVADKEKLEYGYRLDNPNLVVERLGISDFDEIESLNFDLLNCLLKLEDNNSKNKKTTIFTQLKETKNFEFVNSYLKLDNLGEIYRKKFTMFLYSIWETFFSEAKNYEKLLENDLYMYVVDILQFSKKDDLEIINKNNNIIEYIENKKDFFNFNLYAKNIKILEMQPNHSNFFVNLESLDIKFKELEYSDSFDAFSRKGLGWAIFESNFKKKRYILNFNNINLIIKEVLYRDILYKDIQRPSKFEETLSFLKDKKMSLTDEKLNELNNILSRELKVKNYTIINKGLENSSYLLDYLEENMDKYAEIILENCDGKIEEEEEYIIKILNFEDIVEERKQKYIEFLVNNITDFSEINDRNLWNIFLSKKKAEYSEKNIITYFKENGFNEILVQFVNLKLKRLSYKEFNFEEENKSTFFIEVLKCYELDNEVYKNILETLEYNNEAEIIFPEDIPEEKVDILVKLSIIKMNPDNLKFIRSYYKNNLNDFIKLNLENYIKMIDTYNNLFFQDELLVILSDEDIDINLKLKLLGFSKKVIKIMDKDYPVDIKKYILENNYDSSEFLELIENFNNFEEEIKEVIFNIIKNNTSNFYSNLDKAHSSLINKFLKNEEIDNETKLIILINLLDFIKEIETFYKYLKLVNSKDYKNLVKRNTSFNISINEFNLQLLEKLKEKGFIEKFSQIDETTYEVITVKDKEKLID
ncbi:hypothetical protein I6H56_05160 [Fusobacterium canifelinum]|uniref:YobI-like P-loop NTPase domain-containing protein n=1 Tax=Fusobacterium canifelinum TaxID=285729 RepID=A0A7T4KHD2_9FUSO|nr:hypothetical protein [Fusobacterium canifelinum]QQB74844.1 hypothetical protein I6H56_05160 [Fusobacterium canifelinum]